MELSWREIVLFAYRTPEVDELDVWKEKDGRLSLYIQSSEDGVFFHLPPSLSSRPTCASPGTLRLVSLPSGWMDVAVCSRSIGHSIRPGGTVLLSQDPDAYVSTFGQDQCFVGEITDVNVWSPAVRLRQLLKPGTEGKSVWLEHHTLWH